MNRISPRLFSGSVAAFAGVFWVFILTRLILWEESIQPLQDSYRFNERLSNPLQKGVVYTQVLNLPRTLEHADFLVGLFFGCQGGDCGGTVEVRLIQGDWVQVHTSPRLHPDPIVRHRFPFNGFSGGPVKLEIRGLDGGNLRLFYMTQGEGEPMRGPGLSEQAYVSADWFKVISGGEKLNIGFSSVWVGWLWLCTFAGMLGLAWRCLSPATAPRIG